MRRPKKSDAGTPVQIDSPQEEKETQIQKKEQSQRVLGLVPMFAVTNRHNAPPLTPSQKFHLFVKGAFDPFVYVAAGMQAGVSQATNQFEGYGQGASGYGKRYGASLADEVSGQFFSNFSYPVLLKEDPRYFRLGEGSLKHRIGYAIAQEFVVTPIREVGRSVGRMRWVRFQVAGCRTSTIRRGTLASA